LKCYTEPVLEREMNSGTETEQPLISNIKKKVKEIKK